MHWYTDALKKYATFEGRASRREYFVFGLVHAGILLLLMMLAAATASGAAALLYALYVVGTILPGLAVTVRRLHDTDRSAWWLLVGLVPLVGGIIFLVITLLDSTPGRNTYGPSPKAPAEPPPAPSHPTFAGI